MPLLIIFIIIPLIEFTVIIRVADYIGLGWTLLSIVATAFAGSYLLKQQGMATWQRIQQRTAQGALPGDELVQGALILFGGALLLTPGFLTDALGLACLLPGSRQLMASVVGRHLTAKAVVVTRQSVYQRAAGASQPSPFGSDIPPDLNSSVRPSTGANSSRPHISGDVIEGEIVDKDENP